MTVVPDIGEVHGDETEQGDSDEEGPERDEDVRQRGVDDRWVTSYVLEDVKPVSLNDNG